MEHLLWSAGSIPLMAVLGGHVSCPPEIECLLTILWVPPERAPAPGDGATGVAISSDSVRARRRASDHLTEPAGAKEEDATLRAAWETALAVLQPLAARRIGAYQLVFAASHDAPCQELLQALIRGHPQGSWQLGVAFLADLGIIHAARTIDRWVLDQQAPGSWLVDVTDLAR